MPNATDSRDFLRIPCRSTTLAWRRRRAFSATEEGGNPRAGARRLACIVDISATGLRVEIESEATASRAADPKPGEFVDIWLDELGPPCTVQVVRVAQLSPAPRAAGAADAGPRRTLLGCRSVLPLG